MDFCIMIGLLHVHEIRLSTLSFQTTMVFFSHSQGMIMGHFQ